MNNNAEESTEKKKVIRLFDLAPRHDVVGGRRKLVFGEGVVPEADRTRPIDFPRQ